MAEANFIYFGITALIFWTLGSTLFAFKKKAFTLSGKIILWAGTSVIAFFVVLLWLKIERPPMRTLGETRLWYSLFLPFVALLSYEFKKYKWFVIYSVVTASVFILLNLLKPELFNKALMPALQSVWFVPHVIVYIFSYALLAASSIIAAKGLWTIIVKKQKPDALRLADNYVYFGFAFLTLGLIFGALWAKEAWGHYWTWDPKETWAFLTWLSYLFYIHFRYYYPQKHKLQLWILALAFVVLLLCWFGINYMPSAADSVHTYSQS